MNCLSLFDRYVGLGLKGLNFLRKPQFLQFNLFTKFNIFAVTLDLKFILNPFLIV